MGMTATEAAEALDRIDDYGEGVTKRTIGLTNMVWGIAAATIFLAYGTGAGWIEQRGWYWLYGVLWIPGVVAGQWTTSALWKHHAIQLHRAEHPKEGWLRIVAYTGGFFVVAAIVVFGGRALGIDWQISTYMILVNGVLAGAVAGYESRHDRYCGPPTMLAGAALIVVGVLVGISGAGHAAASLIGALAVAIAWFGSGVRIYSLG